MLTTIPGDERSEGSRLMPSIWARRRVLLYSKSLKWMISASYLLETYFDSGMCFESFWACLFWSVVRLDGSPSFGVIRDVPSPAWLAPRSNQTFRRPDTTHWWQSIKLPTDLLQVKQTMLHQLWYLAVFLTVDTLSMRLISGLISSHGAPAGDYGPLR